jgi:uncharacterized low-complexity protein
VTWLGAGALAEAPALTVATTLRAKIDRANATSEVEELAEHDRATRGRCGTAREARVHFKEARVAEERVSADGVPPRELVAVVTQPPPSR